MNINKRQGKSGKPECKDLRQEQHEDQGLLFAEFPPPNVVSSSF
jgi:hypothetical protein